MQRTGDHLSSTLGDFVFRTSAIRACSGRERPAWAWPVLLGVVYAAPAVVLATLVVPRGFDAAEFEQVLAIVWRRSSLIGIVWFIPATFGLWKMWTIAVASRGGLASYILMSPAALWPYVGLFVLACVAAVAIQSDPGARLAGTWAPRTGGIANVMRAASAVMLLAAFIVSTRVARRVIESRAVACMHCGHPLLRPGRCLECGRVDGVLRFS
ncbi:MAG: hypothetical protein AB8G96_14000 [Phycisphaerales bacterium]